MRLRPFFSFYGGKWRIAKHYPEPKYGTIIEPFAGSAGYSMTYPECNVHLYDADPVICGVWDFLIKATPNDILQLPINISHVDELNVCQEAKWFIGFCLNKGNTGPRKSPSAWMRKKHSAYSFWGAPLRLRSASQVDRIKHWTVACKSYEQVSNEVATWFIDPPYFNKGKYYRHTLTPADYGGLAAWCNSRVGRVIVCEQEGATWLPFVPFRTIKTTLGKGQEVIWAEDHV